MTKDFKRVVITRMGAITPLGNSVDEFWKNIIAGKSGVDFITKFDTVLFKTKFARVLMQQLILKRMKQENMICLPSMPLQRQKKQYKMLD